MLINSIIFEFCAYTQKIFFWRIEMKKNGVFAGIIGVALMFGMVLFGCATGGGGGGGNSGAGVPASPPPVSNEQAAQLAADLNAIVAGCATVDGATVKLTGGLGLTKDITVPAGVTLDVTADGAQLGLGNFDPHADNITVTVNGTIIAGSNAVCFEDNASAATINGSGTIRLQSKGSLLTVKGNKNVANRKLTLDGVTLVGIADNNNALVQVGGGGEFILKSGAITGNTTTSGGGGVNVNGGTFIMEGGAISGNTANYGGGVGTEQSTFTLKGGTISGNTAQVKMGGGVYAGNTTFTMEGGTIYGSASNTGDNANEVTGEGAAISFARGEQVVKWGMGGTYTKGGVPQTGGSDIGNSDDTLVVTPSR
jgi:hypothetical protein